ncbi:uncharacterized protein N7483_013124 [Penicillium malachiteum]|uniref:uncharacterized protein n=1 Tax=Penicillium malachiteum TaxID=1324776 RepID=UPI002547DD0F|nr:uncharacterized protein N7483_013124 [Penicillium malachiteum]KAJ5715943.1 hypothetical protein N7483_013124 [Penicillium malachiteum]
MRRNKTVPCSTGLLQSLTGIIKARNVAVMGKSRNVIGAYGRVLPVSGMPTPRDFVMVLVRALYMILQRISLGYLLGRIARDYTLELDTIASSPTISEKPRSNSCVETRALAETCILSDAVASHSDQFLSPPEPDITLPVGHYSPYAGQVSPVNHPSLSSSPPFSRSSNASSGLGGSFQGIGELPNLDEHEACLMRYFVVELAPWFDICDGERNFACTLPLRARTCPPLLNAIFTASARHLSRIKKYWDGNQVHYGGKALPNLTPETAIHYHNECIAHFVSISDHSREAQDENLLAAAVILRFYEEVDCR